MDEFLRPLAEKLPSHIRDTTDFITRLKKLFVTLDVSSLYTNIDTDTGLTIVKEELGKNGPSYPLAKTLTCLLDFTFNDENSIQLKSRVPQRALELLSISLMHTCAY